MARHVTFFRKVRKRDTNSWELTIPHQLLPMLSFYKFWDPIKKERHVLNSKNEDAKLYQWINGNDNIEICDALNGYNHVSGIVTERYVRWHGESCVFGLDYRLRETYLKKGIPLDRVKIFTNKFGNVEIQPILSKSKSNL